MTSTSSLYSFFCTSLAGLIDVRDPLGLVVGCGNGTEALHIKRGMASTSIVALDIDEHFDPQAKTDINLLRADAMRLPFADKSFDFVVTHHSLEHFPDPLEALREMNRVLRDDAALLVAVPNRYRLVGYLGSNTASAWMKLQWNLQDWKARLKGRFRNEFGAHAGFSRSELAMLLGRTGFGNIRHITPEYLNVKYRNKSLITALNATPAADFIFAAHHFVCRKRQAYAD